LGVAGAGCPEPCAGDAEDPKPLLPLPEADDPKPDADDPEDPNADDLLLWGLPLLLLLLPAASLGIVQAPVLAWKYSQCPVRPSQCFKIRTLPVRPSPARMAAFMKSAIVFPFTPISNLRTVKFKPSSTTAVQYLDIGSIFRSCSAVRCA